MKEQSNVWGKMNNPPWPSIYNVLVTSMVKYIQI